MHVSAGADGETIVRIHSHCRAPNSMRSPLQIPYQRMGSSQISLYSRITEQKLFLLKVSEADQMVVALQTYISNSVGIPPAEEDRLRTIDHSLLRRQRVNSVRPKVSDQIDNGSGASNDPPMRSVVHRKLECSQLGLGDPTVFDQLLFSPLLHNVEFS